MRERAFHYLRRPQAEGGVHALDGQAPGRSLHELVQAGPPPLKVALEIIAALCEILYFAEEDGETHGDVHPRNVYLDGDGAVALHGFGRRLRETWAPERRIVGPASDRYGLGYTAYRLLSGHDLDDHAVTADAHEDAVIAAVVDLPLGDLPQGWAPDIQYFIARLLAFHPDERPQAYTVWLSFIAFASDAVGTPLSAWAHDAIAGTAERRDLDRARDPAPPEELLSGPSVREAGLQPGEFTPREIEPRGEISTRFFTKDELRSALGVEPEDDPTGEFENPFEPRAHETTAFFSRAEWREQAMGAASAPRPVRTAPPPELFADEPDELTEPGGVQPSAPSPEPPPRRADSPSPPDAKGGMFSMIGCLVFSLVLLCGGTSIIGAGVGAVVYLRGDAIDLPIAQLDDAEAPAEPVVVPASPRAQPSAPPPEGAAPKPGTDRPTRVVFHVPSSGTIACSDDNSTDVDKRGSITFRKLPTGGVTCAFTVGGRTICEGQVQAGERRCGCEPGSRDLLCH